MKIEFAIGKTYDEGKINLFIFERAGIIIASILVMIEESWQMVESQIIDLEERVKLLEEALDRMAEWSETVEDRLRGLPRVLEKKSPVDPEEVFQVLSKSRRGLTLKAVTARLEGVAEESDVRDALKGLYSSGRVTREHPGWPKPDIWFAK